jgi:hypothetical protein
MAIYFSFLSFQKEVAWCTFHKVQIETLYVLFRWGKVGDDNTNPQLCLIPGELLLTQEAL